MLVLSVRDWLVCTEDVQFPTEGMALAFGISAVRPRALLGDGESVSIQASAGHYCDPKRNGLGGDYTSVEMGYPSVEPNAPVMVYVEDAADPTHTVYGYVPIGIVQAWVDEHGGIVGEAKR